MSEPHQRGAAYMFFERWGQPLATRRLYTVRIIRNLGLACGTIGSALVIGILGYHGLCGFGWLDSLVNASMILGGMGPVDPVRSAAGKWFESFYALFSGVVFLGSVGVIFAPVFHRFLHRFHLELEDPFGRKKG